jgi:hypothetical protein
MDVERNGEETTKSVREATDGTTRNSGVRTWRTSVQSNCTRFERKLNGMHSNPYASDQRVEWSSGGASCLTVDAAELPLRIGESRIPSGVEHCGSGSIFGVD